MVAKIQPAGPYLLGGYGEGLDHALRLAAGLEVPNSHSHGSWTVQSQLCVLLSNVPSILQTARSD